MRESADPRRRIKNRDKLGTPEIRRRVAGLNTGLPSLSKKQYQRLMNKVKG